MLSRRFPDSQESWLLIEEKRMTPREDTLCAILAVLIDELNHNIVEGSKYVSAVLLILKKKELSRTVIDFVADRYLGIYQKGCRLHLILRNSDALRAAIGVVGLGASPKVIEKVVKEAAKFGYIEAVVSLTQNSLHRDPSENEVFYLVHAYIDDKACQSDGTEKQLNDLARKYLSSEQAAYIQATLEKFNEDFRNSD